MITTPKGLLELLYHPPSSSSTTTSPPPPPSTLHAKPPLLFVHGALCSAHDFCFLLPCLASQGYHAYALSVRGHGKSYRQSFTRKLLLTTGGDWARDIACALDMVRARHLDAPPPVLGGHSLGGGFVQYFVGRKDKFASGRGSEARGTWAREGKGDAGHGHVPITTPTTGASPSAPSSTSNDIKLTALSHEISALILLAAAPLSGEGKTINANWHAAEERAGQTREKNLFDTGPPAMVDTPEKVRTVFFSEETQDEVVEKWLGECKTEMEGAVAGLRCFRKMGDYGKILGGINGLGRHCGDQTDILNERVGQWDAGRRTKRRKMLFVAGGVDVLVTPEMVKAEYTKYAQATRDTTDETCMQFVVEGSGHHLMMDAHWEECATVIVRWLQGDSLTL